MAGDATRGSFRRRLAIHGQGPGFRADMTYGRRGQGKWAIASMV